MNERQDQTRAHSGKILFGIAGWSYPDWEGVVYPPGTGDKLRYLAGFVDLIEVNASFYTFVAPATAQDWLARTADLPDFRFSAKANRLFTHEDPRAFGAAEARTFARGVRPLLEGGRLTALVFQFPFSFRDDPAARDRLRRLADAFGDFPLVVEVRHRSWEAPDALGFLLEAGFSVASLDLPMGADTFGATVARREPGYLRLHGRNARDWFRRGAGRDARYDYLYGDDELDELTGRIETLAAAVRELVVVTNNHYRGKALANLAELAARAGRRDLRLPAGLIRTYPRLAAVASAAQGPDLVADQPERRESTPSVSRPPAGGRRAPAPARKPQLDLFES